MIIIPAIDLKEGKAVRLKQGDMDQATEFSSSPAKVAQHWFDQGAKKLHLVDLDGAFAGEICNEIAIKEVIKTLKGKIPIQLGGGIRSIDIMETLFSWGVDDLILGTAALEHPDLVEEACHRFTGQIIVGIDAKEGKVATRGWQYISDRCAIDLGKQFRAMGVKAIVYTDISQDGMLSGVNWQETSHFAREVGVPVIASGGVKGMEDITSLKKVEGSGIVGLIVGRALYTGDLNLAKAQTLVDEVLR